MGSKTKIDWCDSTWNPVTGCMHGCDYCYARRIADRFGGFSLDCNKKPAGIQSCIGVQRLDKPLYTRNSHGIQRAPYPWLFTPTFHRYRLDEPQHWKKPRTIFVCSMADLFGDWVPDSWIQEVFNACEAAPQHRYLFLTKNPRRYIEMYKLHLPYLDNAMFGYTFVPSGCALPCSALRWGARGGTITGEDTFVSIEPITAPLDSLELQCIDDCGWVIVGAETGNRKGKVAPEKWWIDAIAERCNAKGIPIFMKESLRGLMGADFQQEFPWTDKKEP